jgi:succinyl-CoA synthetase beta subunit
MARLDEDAVKKILAGYGVSRPAGVSGRNPGELQSAIADLVPPLYVKAQVPMGDRAAVGAVRRVDDAQEALQAAAAMIGADFRGTVARRVLVESATDGTWSGYAAVRVDDERGARVVVFERGGGSGFDPSQAEPLLELGAVAEPHEIRTALARRGHVGGELSALTDFLSRLCTAAREWSTYVLEVNPFIVTEDGAVVVLDAKAEVDDYSMGLLPAPIGGDGDDLPAREQRALDAQLGDHQGTLRYVQLIDEDDEAAAATHVGSHAVGGGESMIIMDALADCGLSPTNYCDTSGSPSREKVATAAELIAGQPHIRGYFFSSCIANQPLSVTANGIVDGFRSASWTGPTVLRIAGNQEDEAVEILRAWGDTVAGPVRVFGRETDEWTAARLLAEMLAGD